MPSGPDHLREKFMKHCPTCGQATTDGIAEAELIITNAGVKIDRGWIKLPDEFGWQVGDNQEIRDAIQYLVEEWDYAIGSPPPAAAVSPIQASPPWGSQPAVEYVTVIVTKDGDVTESFLFMGDRRTISKQAEEKFMTAFGFDMKNWDPERLKDVLDDGHWSQGNTAVFISWPTVAPPPPAEPPQSKEPEANGTEPSSL